METKWPFGIQGSASLGEIELDHDERPETEVWPFRNKFLALRNDLVIFPGGQKGTYVSVQERMGRRAGGVAMLPVVNSQIILIRVFRHAPRRWEWEIPRGFIDAGEQPLQSAARELLEECGVVAKQTHQLGAMNADSGLFAYDTLCFLCELDAPPQNAGEHSKAAPLVLSPSEVFRRIGAGELRDGFLAYSLASAIGLGLINL